MNTPIPINSFLNETVKLYKERYTDEERQQITRECQKEIRFRHAEHLLRDTGFCPNPECNTCNGIGWVTAWSEDKLKNIAKYCPAKGCMGDSYQKHSMGEAQMLQRGIRQRYTFLNFNRVKGSYEALQAAKAWVDQKFVMLLITGGVGNGKTHLCQAAAYELANRQRDVFIYTIPDLLSKLKSLITPQHPEDKDDYSQMLDHLKNTEYLILDEFKARSPYELEVLEEIICHRYERCKFTFITSNLDLPELEKVSERILSRFSDKELSKCVVNKAEDYRPNKDKQ